MTWLLLSILANAGIYLVFKWFGQHNISLFPAIVTNYFVAFVLGFLMVQDRGQALEAAGEFPLWLIGGLSLGLIFIGIFYLMGITAQKIGISVSTIASKMSLALGVLLLAVVDENEIITVYKIVAIVLALAGVVLVSTRGDGNRFHWKMLGFPIAILLGSTIIDFGVAWFSSFPSTESELQLFSCLSFGIAALTGIVVLIIKRALGKNDTISRRDLLAGAGLGLINYCSIYFIVKAYESGEWSRSTVLPVNNLAVVAVSALAARILFGEKLNNINRAGILVCIIALALLIREA